MYLAPLHLACVYIIFNCFDKNLLAKKEMGSNYFGNLSLGNERSSPTNNNSSRKGKKSSSDKPPKQPQRGLGVAQLEKIRLHSQIEASTYPPQSNHYFPSSTNVSQEDSEWKTPYSSSPSFSYSFSSSSSLSSFDLPAVQQQSFMMGLNDEMGNMRFPDSVHQSTPTSR
ncbi:hypothetical protein Leryth_020742, partial [Lithospermum erythrorhizon]